MSENTDKHRASGDDGKKGRVARSEPEVDDLIRILRRYGVLTRKDLFERSRAQHWAGQSFEGALRLGVAEGSIRQLGGDLFEAGEDPPDLSSGRFDPP
jgi:hypothetical protein